MQSQQQRQIIVALGCVIHDQKILLTKRGEKEQLDIDSMWELPGGKVEFGESPLETAIREVKEETGCEVGQPASLPFPYTRVRQYKDFELHVVINCYECKLLHKVENFSPNSSKILDIKWVDISDIQFMDIIAGSREFIYWIIQNKHGVQFDWESTSKQRFQSYIHFECYKPLQNQKKFYFINVGFDPDPAQKIRYHLSRFWGKIRSKDKILSKHFNFNDSEARNVKFERYEDESSVRERMIALAQEKVNKGYKVVDYTPNLPIKEWLQENKEHVQTSFYPPIQLELDLHGVCKTK